MAFLALHGGFGEDGGLQALLESKGLRYTGSTSQASKLCFDKRGAKALLRDYGLASGLEISREGLTSQDLPVVVKPNQDGSSVGVSIVRSMDELEAAFKAADKEGGILVEEFISGREFSCAVTELFGGVSALPIVEIKPKAAFFDYEAKYTEGMCEEICPAELDEKTTETILRQSELAFEKLGARQYGRIDWIVRDGVPYFLEMNTLPGMTPTSLINKELAAAGTPFDEFIAKLIETA